MSELDRGFFVTPRIAQGLTHENKEQQSKPSGQRHDDRDQSLLGFGFALRGLRGIEHPSDPDAEDVTWAAEAAIQTKAVADIVNELVELLSYKTPEAEAA